MLLGQALLAQSGQLAEGERLNRSTLSSLMFIATVERFYQSNISATGAGTGTPITVNR